MIKLGFVALKWTNMHNNGLIPFGMTGSYSLDTTTGSIWNTNDPGRAQALPGSFVVKLQVLIYQTLRLSGLIFFYRGRL